MVTGITPDRVTTDGHDSYPRAIRTVLGTCVRHRDSQYLNNRLEQDHRGVKGRYGPMRGFKCPRSAGEFCRAYALPWTGCLSSDARTMSASHKAKKGLGHCVGPLRDPHPSNTIPSAVS
jgi:transposase-like protein